MSMLEELAGTVSRPDEQARREAEDTLSRQPGGGAALGRVGELAAWLAGVQGRCPTWPIARPRLVIVAGDHGIGAAGVDPDEAPHTSRTLHDISSGTATVSRVAEIVGVPLQVVDLGVDAEPDTLPVGVVPRQVRRGSGRIDVEDATTLDQAVAAFETGLTLADEAVDSGTDLILCGHVGAAATTSAAVLVAALVNRDPASVCAPFGGIPDQVWIRRCAAIRDSLRRARPVLGDQLQLLATVGGADLAALTGLLVQAAVRRTPVVVDGVVASAAALVAHRIAFRASGWWVAGDVSAEPAHAAALDRLTLPTVHEIGTGLHDGTGSLLAVPTLRAAAAALSP